MFHASISAPCSATKSSTTWAPLPLVRSLTASTWLPSPTTVWLAPSCSASLSASGLRSTTMMFLADRVVGGDPGVGQRGDVLRLRRRVELDAGAGRGEQVLGHPAVGGQPWER